jgi:Putative prokaryotic signal transducing protein
MSVKGWTVVFQGERIQADLVAAVLGADGVRVEVFGDHAYGVGVNLTAARVMVPDDQAETARRLIREAESAPVEPDEAGEPEDA